MEDFQKTLLTVPQVAEAWRFIHRLSTLLSTGASSAIYA